MTQISMKTPNLVPHIKTLKNLYAHFVNPARQKATEGAMERVQAKMQEPGEKPSYPIQWDSERQRRAFFATDGFGGGIPHVRTGEYEKSWKIERITPGSVRLFSNSKAAPFVGGDAFGLVKSNIHTGRWNLLKGEWMTEWAKLPQSHAEATQGAIRQAFAGYGSK